MIERRVTAIERQTFGFQDEQRNIWIPGMLQVMSEMNAQLKWFVRISWIIAPAVVAIVVHQYGIGDIVGKALQGMH